MQITHFCKIISQRIYLFSHLTINLLSIHPFIHPFIHYHSLSLIQLCTHFSLRSFLHSINVSINQSCYSFIHSLTSSSIHLFIHLFIQASIHIPSVYPIVYPFLYLSVHPSSYSFINSLRFSSNFQCICPSIHCYTFIHSSSLNKQSIIHPSIHPSVPLSNHLFTQTCIQSISLL